ncbi:MAG TPA: HD domain-containing phosphohydrolase [Longimicrobiales bacterium]|nr:HD domain-containing phosphohydrolase [Longimicrobiales bacterium]
MTPSRATSAATPAGELERLQEEVASLRAQVERGRSELRELNQIGMALMTERDPDRLLERILSQAVRLTGSDAASLYLVEEGEDGGRQLRFKLARNDSLPEIPLVEFTLPIDRTSLAGYVADTGQPLVIADAYHLDEEPATSFSFNHSFDERFGYRTRSLLVVPMADHRSQMVGVLQLINRKRQGDARITTEEEANAFVVPYDEHELELAQGLAGQAAVSIENSRLYRQIEQIFESFVKASVTAIDQRDPTTAGHSVRVATLTCDMAEVLERHDRGPYRETRFTREQMKELRYAALLHDFGKVAVREEVLVKAKKLPPPLLERVEARFDVIRRGAEAEYYRRRAELLEAHGPRALAEGAVDELKGEFARRLDEIERFHAAIRAANEPSVLPEHSAEILNEIAQQRYHTPRGEEAPFLTGEELGFLSIPKGSLDARERREIESHVEQTYRFLLQIPWTDDLKNLAEIAHGHHEKLNGQGYPRGLRAEEIPVQTRIMTVADIFDALTASDRPYKKALGAERALDILRMEARDGLLDPELVTLFIDSRIYQRVLEADWREL